MGSPGLDHSGPHADGTGHDAYDQGMTAPGFTIDTPRLEDAPAIARVHVESWRDAYAHLLEDHEHWFGAPALEIARAIREGLGAHQHGKDSQP